jgi:decaprenylphospho-beta-D-ribofuranose 2-oxidase
MHAAPGELRVVPHQWEDLASFTELAHARCLVLAPRGRGDLRRIFAWAGREGAHVTFRAGGHSFDDQALGVDEPPCDAPHVVVSTRGLASIAVDAPGRRMTVGPGATWGDILARLQPLGLVPYVTVTTAHATAGGTLSGDCLSRFSPAYGKEGRHIVEVTLMTPDGVEHVCRPPPPHQSPRTLPERLFCGVVGGLGYLGAITSITYDLLHVGQTDGRIGVESYVLKYETFGQLATELVPLVRRIHEREPEAPESIFSALWSHGGQERAIVIHSRYTRSRDRIPMACHEPYTFVRLVVEWLLRVSWLTGFMWRIFYGLLQVGHRYVDDLEGFTFMMDGNVRAKRVAQSMGFAQRAIQQTFIIPVHSDQHAWETADQRLREFLAAAVAVFDEKGLEPTMMDVLYIPRDEHFLLSASTGMSGFAVSFAFETNDGERLRAIEQCFRTLSHACHETGGRVYLVKNVRADAALLEQMYAATLPELIALKREVDPRGVVRNAFLERNFPSVAAAIAERDGAGALSHKSGAAARSRAAAE